MNRARKACFNSRAGASNSSSEAWADYQIARKYCNKLKERLDKEGSQLVTNCHQLKMTAEDGRHLTPLDIFRPIA